MYKNIDDQLKPKTTNHDVYELKFQYSISILETEIYHVMI